MKIMKKLMLNFNIAVMLTFAISGLQSCKKKCYDPKNPECKNFNAELLKPSANFRMRQSMVPFGFQDKSGNIAEFSDTICTSEPGVMFEALEENANRYEWIIGIDERKFNTKKVYLQFTSFLKDSSNFGVKIPVKLRIVKSPENLLNPKDSVYEKTRNLVFLPLFLWQGKFEGVFEGNPKERTTIEIGTRPQIYTFPPGIFADRPKDSVKLESYIFKGLPARPFIAVSWEHGNNENNCDVNYTSYKQWNWQISELNINTSNGIDELTSGLLGFHAYADINDSGKQIITVIYKFRPNKNSSIQTYTFKGERVL
jgi:hypothetical protein